ncbi:MAG TPA: (deoxy)nucleoside triphosphate pyrophosphohydrolase [Vicinamibacterales bacterium]|nr:(deoxy)nucleoside triphosphate pyrophosphohydrolase [Vicinamibacterales bacterium]
MPPRVIVTAAIIERNGAFLVTRRPRGVHLEGLWEFPGGKCESDESLAGCLEREIREELGTPCEVGREIFSVSHAYPDRIVELHFHACRLTGEPQPLLRQEMRWVTRQELRHLDFPPADADFIEALVRGAEPA